MLLGNPYQSQAMAFQGILRGGRQECVSLPHASCAPESTQQAEYMQALSLP